MTKEEWLTRGRAMKDPVDVIAEALQRCVRWFWYSTLYRPVMRLAHRFNWHYAPPVYPDGDTLLWCHWCGLRAVVKRRGDVDAIPTLAAYTAASAPNVVSRG